MAERTHDPMEQGDVEELHSLIEPYQSAQFITHGPEGHFHARPMATQPPDGDGHLWFVTWADSQKCTDLEANPRCGVAFHDSARSATWISLSGTGEVIRDRELAEKMWRPSWSLWFPQGPSDPDVALIRFTPEHAEYVHPTTGRLKVLFTVAKSLVTGKASEPAVRRTIDLSH